MRQVIQELTPAVGSVPEALRLLGPDQAAPILDDIIHQYARLRAEFGKKYDAYADAVHAGTRSSSDMPEYPRAAEFLFQPALGLAKEWKTASVASNLYEALAAAQTGRYTILLNRQIMAVLAELDPDQSRSRLLGMGFPEKEIDAAFQLNQLRPIPYMLAPRQGKIALSKPSRPEPP